MRRLLFPLLALLLAVPLAAQDVPASESLLIHFLDWELRNEK